MLKESHAELKSGERVLVVGEAGTGRTLLFRALAGLWPWGAGHIVRPGGEPMHYMPRVAYLPPGSLRQVLAYPAEVEQFKKNQFVKALDRLHLRRLIPMLDQTKRWEQELNETEQRQLSFARLLLQLPPWLLSDEALDGLDAPTLETVKDIFAHELKQTGLIHIGQEPAAGEFYSRVLHLVNDPNLRRLERPASANHSRRGHKEMARTDE